MLEELASTVDFEIDRRPFLLRPDAVEDGIGSMDSSMDSQERESNGRRPPLYRPGEGLSDTEPASNRALSTLLVHAATAYAKESGLDGQFYRSAAKEYWEQGTDLGLLYTIRRITVLAGLDWGDLWPKLQSGSYHNLVLAQHAEAKAAGVTQTPSFQVNGRLHSGAITKDELRAAVQTTR
ncbi:MAG: DsbA family protein [SAR202 cluster bacterium]|nr:DsbA family protein [SAR202 cluster bacterium]